MERNVRGTRIFFPGIRFKAYGFQKYGIIVHGTTPERHVSQSSDQIASGAGASSTHSPRQSRRQYGRKYMTRSAFAFLQWKHQVNSSSSVHDIGKVAIAGPSTIDLRYHLPAVLQKVISQIPYLCRIGWN